MKKLFLAFLLTAAIILTACGSDELEDFTESFNKNATTNKVAQLNPDNFGKIEKEESMSWKPLYDSEEYTIDGKYKDGSNLSGFYLVIDNEQPYEDLKGAGYDASLTISEALDLDKSKYIEEYEKALTLSSHTYTDKDYRVEYTNPGESGLTSVGMIINYDKK